MELNNSSKNTVPGIFTLDIANTAGNVVVTTSVQNIWPNSWRRGRINPVFLGPSFTHARRVSGVFLGRIWKPTFQKRRGEPELERNWLLLFLIERSRIKASTTCNYIAGGRKKCLSRHCHLNWAISLPHKWHISFCQNHDNFRIIRKEEKDVKERFKKENNAHLSGGVKTTIS